MRNKFIFISILLVSIYFLCWVFNLTPFVIDFSQEQKKPNLKIELGDTLRPLESLNFEDGQWEMYVKYSLNDMCSNDNLLKGRVFICTDKKIMLQIKENLSCIYTGADIATADSKFYVYNNGKLMFISNAVIDENICGIQSPNYGWVSNKRLKSLFSDFKIVKSPLIFF